MMPETRNALMDRLEREEGTVKLPNGNHKLYLDSRNINTIGHGYAIGFLGLPDDIVEELFARTVTEAIQMAQGIPGFKTLTDARQSVIVAMVFQLGANAVLRFHDMLNAIAASQWPDAAAAMLDSDWHRQTPARCEREALIMRTGLLPQSGAAV